MKRVLTVLQRGGRPGVGTSRKFTIVERDGAFIGYKAHGGQTSYVNQKILGVVVAKDDSYYVVVEGRLQDANKAIDEYLKHPVDRFSNRPFNPVLAMLEMMLNTEG